MRLPIPVRSGIYSSIEVLASGQISRQRWWILVPLWMAWGFIRSRWAVHDWRRRRRRRVEEEKVLFKCGLWGFCTLLDGRYPKKKIYGMYGGWGRRWPRCVLKVFHAPPAKAGCRRKSLDWGRRMSGKSLLISHAKTRLLLRTANNSKKVHPSTKIYIVYTRTRPHCRNWCKC